LKTGRLLLAMFAFMALSGLVFSGSSVSVESSRSKGAAPGSEVLANSMDTGLTVDASITVNAAEPAVNPLFPVPATVSDSILLSDPTFVRPSAGAITSCPPSGNPTVHYKLYEFNISGCLSAAPVTIDTCASGAGLDTVLFVYRKSDGSPSSAVSPTFSPGSPCANVVASNNNNAAACGAGTLLSSITTPLSDGNIVVVVATNGVNQTGNFTLSVTSGTCVVTQVPSCNPSITPTSDSFLAAGGAGTANITIGPACAWTAVSNDSFIQITSGAAGAGNGSVSYSVDANSGPARVGTMTIAGQTFTVTQEAGAISLPCIHDALVNGNPNYTRPSVSGAGVVSCPATGNPTTRYKAYEFELTGCPSALVNVNTCANGVCAGPVTLADTVVTLYRKADGSGSSPGNEIFNSANPCTNAVTGNNNSSACGAGSTLSSFTQTVAAGRFVVVVTSNSAGDVGTFRLSVSTATSGCNIALVPACPSITGTVTPSNQTSCAGNSANINVSVSGGTAPYTVSLDNGGGSQNGAGPFNFSVSPSSTTTYTATGADANGCPITMSGTATVTVQEATSTTDPPDQAVCQGTTANFSTTASGTGPFHYAWTVDGSPFNGDSSSINVPTGSLSVGDHTVAVTVTGTCGNASQSATLTVQATTSTTDPADQTVCQGGVAIFSTNASGTGPFSFVWKQGTTVLNNGDLGGRVAIVNSSTSSTLTISNVQQTDAGAYTVETTGACGMAAQSANLTVGGGPVTAVGPANVWIGLKNSDDVGTKFDLLAEVFQNNVLIGSGQLNDVSGGSSGFNNAVQRTINMALTGSPGFCSGGTLSFRLSVRIAASSGHVSGTARLWYNDAAANSRFEMTISGTPTTYYLRDGFVLATTPGPGPRKTSDVLVNRNQGGNPFKPFGTWTTTF
jgi:hypothetical protein